MQAFRPSTIVVLVLAGALGACSSSSSSGDGSDSGATVSDTVQDLCVATVNSYRATLGLAALTRWKDNETCANNQAKSDSESGTAHGAFSTCPNMAQDECPGWGGTSESVVKDCLQMMWAEGPGTDYSKHGHYINMSSSKYTQVSCGFYQTPSGKWWAVQDFR